ncbi:hypothetical protein SAMN05444166_4909 [Singulisphaera sp. GP187]|nr:hypothetical protein SAMN05444166_4909 [Singulisphaera sp. GP187]
MSRRYAQLVDIKRESRLSDFSGAGIDDEQKSLKAGAGPTINDP